MSTLTEAEQTQEELESGFRIDGKIYPVPALDSFDMDEGQILWDTCGVTIEDFAPVPDEASDEEKLEHLEKLTRYTKNPAFLRALMLVAYRRGNPKLPMGRVRDVIAASNHLEAMADFIRVSAARRREGDPRVPPAQATEQPRSSSGSSVSSSESSGIASENGSTEPEDPHATTGRSSSDTSHTSVPTRSED